MVVMWRKDITEIIYDANLFFEMAQILMKPKTRSFHFSTCNQYTESRSQFLCERKFTSPSKIKPEKYKPANS